MKKKSFNMKEFAEIKKEWLKDPEIKRGYAELELQYALIYAIMDSRIKQGLTQEELAQKVGIAQSSIARFESGGYNPTLLFVQRLADALGVKITVKV